MKQTSYGISAYQAAQRTIPPLKVVVMLYDGVLIRIMKAAAFARQGEFQQQFDSVMSAARIIDGLDRYLDMECGGQVAVGLRDTYQAVARALFRSVGSDKAPEVCDKLATAVRELRDAWAEIAGVSPTELSAAQPAVSAPSAA